MASKVMRVGICGGGTVGGGVYQILTSKAKNVEVVKVCVRDMKKKREWCDDPSKLCESWEAIVKDDSIDVVVEVMGGVDAAKDCVFEALKRGKHVVTANKALLATQMDALLKERQKSLGFEAAVCGGIPIIATLQDHMIYDDISSVKGIMNGVSYFFFFGVTFCPADDELHAVEDGRGGRCV